MTASRDELIEQFAHDLVGGGAPTIPARQLAELMVVDKGWRPSQDTDLERGRKLASARDDLIAAGADPTELVVPLAPRGEVLGEVIETLDQEWLSIPIPPDAEAIGRMARGLHDYLTPHPELGTDRPGSLGVCSECERIARVALSALSGEVETDG